MVDKVGLRRNIKFKTRITPADFDESTERWTVTTDTGDRVTAQFLVMGTGGLTEVVLPDIPGRESFAGES